MSISLNDHEQRISELEKASSSGSSGPYFCKSNTFENSDGVTVEISNTSTSKIIILTGGLYWCMVTHYEGHNGGSNIKVNNVVRSAGSGYAGSTGVCSLVEVFKPNDVIELYSNHLSSDVVRSLFKIN